MRQSGFCRPKRRWKRRNHHSARASGFQTSGSRLPYPSRRDKRRRSLVRPDCRLVPRPERRLQRPPMTGRSRLVFRALGWRRSVKDRRSADRTDTPPRRDRRRNCLAMRQRQHTARRPPRRNRIRRWQAPRASGGDVAIVRLQHRKRTRCRRGSLRCCPTARQRIRNPRLQRRRCQTGHFQEAEDRPAIASRRRSRR